MPRREKLLARFLSEPTDFHYRELVNLLRLLGFTEIKTGRTSGSRVKFADKRGRVVSFHKPHPSGIIKKYQIRRIKEIIGL